MSVVGVQSRHSACPGYDAITTCRVPDAVQRANAAPQSRDHWSDVLDGPRIGSAPLTRCAASGTRSTWTLALLLYGSLGRASQLFGAASASAGASVSPPTTSPNEAKNSPANFFAVESIQPLAELRQLAADLGVDLIMQDRDLGAFGFQPNGGAALGKARHTAGAFAGNAIAVRRVEIGQCHLAAERRLDGADPEHHGGSHFGRRRHFEALAARNAFFQDVGIVDRGPDFFLVRRDALAVVHLHNWIPPKHLWWCAVRAG